MPANMQDYVTVAERLNQAKSEIKTISADAPVMLSDTMGYIRVLVVLQDNRSATGTASFQLGLQGKGAQATNPIEDCETSAVGRALALLGYSSSKSIASREEVYEAQRRAGDGASYEAPTRPAPTPTPRPQANGGDVPLCEVHKQPMRPGKNGGWFCATKLPDGTWCRGRSLKTEAPDTSEWDAIDAASATRRAN